jgi:hypothetical protein
MWQMLKSSSKGRQDCDQILFVLDAELVRLVYVMIGLKIKKKKKIFRFMPGCLLVLVF